MCICVLACPNQRARSRSGPMLQVSPEVELWKELVGRKEPGMVRPM